MKEKNRGFTFIELILIIAIASILSGAAIYSLQLIKSVNVKGCVNDISSMLNKVRLLSMTKKDKPNLYIYQYNGAYYLKQQYDDPDDPYDVELDESGTLLSNDDIEIIGIVYADPTNITQEVNSTSYLTIKFKRSTGEILADATDPFLNGNSPGYDCIRVTYKDMSYDIKFVKFTGKHYIE